MYCGRWACGCEDSAGPQHVACFGGPDEVREDDIVGQNIDFQPFSLLIILLLVDFHLKLCKNLVNSIV